MKWKSNGYWAENEYGQAMADCSTQYGNPGKANARLIIKAVNNHDRLVEALREVVTFYEGQNGFPKDDYFKWLEQRDKTIYKVRALLASLDEGVTSAEKSSLAGEP